MYSLYILCALLTLNQIDLAITLSRLAMDVQKALRLWLIFAVLLFASQRHSGAFWSFARVGFFLFSREANLVFILLRFLMQSMRRAASSEAQGFWFREPRSVSTTTW